MDSPRLDPDRVGPDLLARVVELGHHTSPEDAVREALLRYRRDLERQGIVSLFGTIEYEEGRDPR